MNSIYHTWVLGLAACWTFSFGIAQETTESQEPSPFEIEMGKIDWQREGAGTLGKEAEVQIPEGFMFTSRKGTERFLKLTGNVVGSTELGIICPENLDWWALFQFDDVGYVKDDEEIDPDKLLKTMKENDKAANEYRKREGLRAIYLEGWEKEPFYNSETNIFGMGHSDSK